VEPVMETTGVAPKIDGLLTLVIEPVTIWNDSLTGRRNSREPRIAARN
jgi:hypothetical protein